MIIVFFFSSCSMSTEKMLAAIEDYIYTGEYVKAENLISRIDAEKLPDQHREYFDFVKAYLKYSQGYWPVAEKLLSGMNPHNERLHNLAGILRGYIRLNTGKIQEALLTAKEILDNLPDDEKKTAGKQRKTPGFGRVMILLCGLFIECYDAIGDKALMGFYISELSAFCAANKIESENNLVFYYRTLAAEDDLMYETLFTFAKKKPLTINLKIRSGLSAMEQGVDHSRFETVSDEMKVILKLAQSNHAYYHAAQCDYLLGCIEKENSRWADASSYFNESSITFESIQNTSAHAMAEYQYGICLYHDGQYIAAEEPLKSAESFYKTDGNKEIHAGLSQYLGSLYKIMGHFKMAENYFLTAYDFYSSDAFLYKDKIIECLLDLGVILSSQREYDRALSYLDRLLPYLEVKKGAENIQYAYLCNNRGQINRNMGNMANAILDYQTGLEYAPAGSEIRARILLNMADYYYSVHKEDETDKCLESASFIIQNENYKKLSGEILYFRARIRLDKKEYESALLLLKQALEFFSLIGDMKYKAKVLYSSGIAYMNSRSYTDAIDALAGAADIFDAISLTIVDKDAKTEFRKEYGFVLELLVNLLIREKKYDRAFYYAEKTRARNLLENMYENDMETGSLIPPELEERRQYLVYLKNSLSERYFSGSMPASSVMQTISGIDDELDSIRRQIELVVPEALALEGASVCTKDEAMKQLGPQDLILEFHIAGNNLYLFMLTDKELSCVLLNGPDSILDQYLNTGREKSGIESTAYRYMEMLKDYTSPVSRITPAGKKLFDTLIKPVYDDAVKKTNWIVVPDKKLFYLPFAALINVNGRYLIEENVSIGYSHSATMYVRQKTRERARPEKQFLFFALPDNSLFNGWKQDAFAIRDSYTSPICFFNDDAKESTLRTMDITPYKTIQFLLHGFTFGTFGHLNSNGIVLAENEPEGYDGCITLEEIFVLRMNPDLLILTACSSGLGEEIDGEGLYGMNHAFFYAGAQSILSTLWNVYIVETNRYSIILSRLNASGKLSPKAAVIQAQKQLFMENKHPVYWAPFVLFGYGGE